MKRTLLLLAGVLAGALTGAVQAQGTATYKIVHNGDYVYFCQDEGVSRLEKASGLWTAYTQENGMLPSKKQGTIALQDGTLWVGGEKGWVTSIAGDSKESRQYEMTKDGLAVPGLYGTISEIAFDWQGRMAIGMSNCVRGVVDGVAQECQTIPSLLTEQHVEDLLFDGKGTLWIASSGESAENCLARYTFDGGLDFVLKGLEKPAPFTFGSCMCVAVDAGGNVWFNPGKQLVRYDGTTFTAYDAVASASDMAFDAEGRLWMAGLRGGLTCFANGEATQYPCELTKPYPADKWNCIDIDGSVIYIGTQTGVLKFENGTFTPLDIPGATTGIRLTPQDTKATDSPVYSTDGKRLDSQPRRSIVIKDGRKVIMRSK